MLAPIDKLKSRVNDILQIVVTTSCNLNCSNCTQLLPFRRDYLHMSLECFQEAVESVKDWPGVIALFGGNPCSHPKFPELCKILASIIPDQKRRGLWTNDLLSHGDIARETFYPDGRFNLNAHGIDKAGWKIESNLPGRLIPMSEVNHSIHAPIMAHYEDMGISYFKFVEYREQCDINQKWSGAIVERFGQPYAYFCEVAAALDGIKGVANNGIRVYPEWWKAGIERFSGQIYNCCDHGCGVPLKLKGRRDDEEKYDISPQYSGIKKRRPVGDVMITPQTEVNAREVTDYMNVRSK